MDSFSRHQLHRKKLPNGANATGYDGVFAGSGPRFGGGAQPRQASRIEDYGEIFGGGGRRGSSIPVLDISALGQARVSASKLDYSAIFGGFRDGGDLGASYDEMFAKPNGARNFSSGARAPANKVSHSDGTDKLNNYRDEAFQNEAPNHSFAGVKQFNMSYHKSSQSSNDGKDGTTRVTQLRAVPGFTCFVEENPLLQKKEADEYVPPAKVNVTSPPKIYANSAYTPSSDGRGIFESQSSGHKLYSADKSFGANEAKTHPSKMSLPSNMSANLTSNKSVPTQSIGSNSKVPKSDASQAGPGYCSLSSSDEELDVNSAAAASAAALRKAVEAAQASIKIAKEFMERKKDAAQRFSKPRSKNGLENNNRRDDKFAVEETRYREKNAKETAEYDDIASQVFSKSEREKARRSGKVAPDIKQAEEISLIKEVARDTNGSKLESAESCGAFRQISGTVIQGECRTATLSCERVGGGNSIFEAADMHVCRGKEMETKKEILEPLDASGKKVDAEVQKLEGLEVKLNPIQEMRVLDQHGDRLDAVQDVQELEDDHNPGVAQVDEETEEEQKASNASEKCENEVEEIFEPKENEEFQSTGDRESDGDEEGLDEGPESTENVKNLDDFFVDVQNEKLEEFFDLKENEDFESQQVTADNYEGLDEARGCSENESTLEEIIGEEQNELLEEFLDVKENEEDFESQGVNADHDNEGPDEAQGSLGNERKLEYEVGEEQNEKLLEEFLDVKENEELQFEGVKVSTNEGLDEAQVCMENEKKYEDIFGEEQNEKLMGEFMDLEEDEEEESQLQGVKANNNEVGVDEPPICIEKERKLEDIFEEEQNEILLDNTLDLKENEEFDSQGGKVNNNEEGQDEDQGCIENKLKDILDEEQNKKLVNDIHEEENGHGLGKSCEQNKFDKGLEASGLLGGYEEAFEVESIERKQHDAHVENDNERSSDKSHDLGVSKKSFNDTSDGEECEEIQEEDRDLEEMDVLVDEDEDTESIQRATKGDETMKVYHEAVEETMNLDATIDASKSEASESESEEVHKDVKDDYGSSFEDNDNMSDVTECSGEFPLNENDSEAAEMAYEVRNKESCNSGGPFGDAAEHIEMENKTKDVSEARLFNHSPEDIGLNDMSFRAKQTDQNEMESESSTTVGSGIKILEGDSSVEREKEVDEKIVSDPEEVKTTFDTGHVRRVRKQWFETGKKMEPSQPPSIFEGEKKTTGVDEDIKMDPIINEVAKIDVDTAHERRVRKQWFETGKKIETSEPPSINRGEEKTIRIDEEIKTNPITDKKVDNPTKTHTVQEKETKEVERKEVKKEYLRKVDEANKREREKDRMAVERVIREARERAFNEARERAEKAAVEKAAEVRKRKMGETRQNAEKASPPTKPPAERALEAKLRAERAAVERATAEARERALEKALSQKATSGVRENAERYVSEKVSAAFRESGMRPSSSSSSDAQKLNESDGESVERRKARLERNERTMERAAKALAEKNRRDLLAQKEQAERNRFAETLDAEVKRWASGKEGNLRALLSTLQYVLGPNSNWQPVSLTDIVTTSAVKKAYRKATLHVHPDKLQQRGATIQQKYICEKVFDLLKAAWNKFNSEQR